MAAITGLPSRSRVGPIGPGRCRRPGGGRRRPTPSGRRRRRSSHRRRSARRRTARRRHRRPRTPRAARRRSPSRRRCGARAGRWSTTRTDWWSSVRTVIGQVYRGADAAHDAGLDGGRAFDHRARGDRGGRVGRHGQPRPAWPPERRRLHPGARRGGRPRAQVPTRPGGVTPGGGPQPRHRRRRPADQLVVLLQRRRRRRGGLRRGRLRPARAHRTERRHPSPGGRHRCRARPPRRRLDLRRGRRSTPTTSPTSPGAASAW